MLLMNELKPEKQRKILAIIGKEFIRMSKEEDDEYVETLLETLEFGVLEELGDQDFFGTEGWQHYFGLD